MAAGLRLRCPVDQADLLPGRSVQAVRNETRDGLGRSNAHRVGTTEDGEGKRGRGRCDGADAECRARTAGRVRQRLFLGVGCVMIIRCGIGSVLAMLDVSSIGSHVVHVVGHRRRAGLLLNRTAGHADGRRDRVQRKHSHQEPYQQCREQAVHRSDEYSTTDFPDGRACAWP